MGQTVGAGGAWRRAGWRLPRAVALLLSLALLPAPAGAQGPDDWVLESFEVRYLREDVELKRETVPASGTREFEWGGREEHGEAYPRGSIVLDGRLRLKLPDRIRPGQPFAVAGEATGEVDTPGRDPASTDYSALLVLDLKCYDPALCNLGDNAFQPLVPAKPVSLAVTVPDKSVTLDEDPTRQPLGALLFVHAGLGSTMPNDDYWTIDIAAYYRRPEPANAYTLWLDSDNPRLPPSGQRPSTATLTATVRDPGGGPVPGESVQLRLDPPDLGRLSATSASTDAQGEARVLYTAPDVAGLRGRGEVAVWATVPGRGLERAMTLRIERFGLQLAVEPAELALRDPPEPARVRATVRDFEGRPVVGDDIAFTMNPAGLGSLRPERASTNAQGLAEVEYLPPLASALKGVGEVTVYAENRTHGGQEGALIRFKGLHVTASDPPNGAKDVDWETLRAVAITFDQRLNDFSLTGDAVRVETLTHGNLGPEMAIQGHTLIIRLTDQPIPDVGLQVKVTLRGGERGLRGMDGSPLLGDFVLRFQTMPRLQPRLILSQTVDDPRDLVFEEVRSLVRKPFAVRVAAGLPAESELESEAVEVLLVGPHEGTQERRTHTFYPGDRPPLVPEAAAASGNTANFLVRSPPVIGQYAYRAELRPLSAPEDKRVTVFADDINMTRFETGKDTVKGVLVIPIVNDLIPGYAWRTSRGQQADWLATRAAEAGELLPTERVAGLLGYLADTTCPASSGNIDCVDRAPWTHFQAWARNVGRAGMFTRFSYVVGLVPEGYFGSLAEHPDVQARPDAYHNMVWNRIWSYQVRDADGNESAGAPVSLVEVGASGAVLAHAIGHAEGLGDRRGARDALRGYDLRSDRVMVADAEGWRGAYLAAMNLDVGLGPTWMATADYQALAARWTARCFGRPPCPQEPAASGPRVGLGLAAATDPEQPVVGVSGVIRRTGGGEEARLDPLLLTTGRPTLAAGGGGSHALELRAGDGSVLGHYAFTPAMAPAGDGQLASFLAALPWDPAVAAVALVQGGRDLALRARSAHPPTVAFTAPAPGSRLRGPVTVAWAGQDADGDALGYQLLWSADGGESWQPLAVDTRATRLELDSRLVPNAAAGRLRVLASDGFHSGQAELPLALDNPLELLGLVPPDGARDVGTGSTILAQFRDPLDPARLGEASLRLRDASGMELGGRLRYDPLDASLSFLPDRPLAPGRWHEARLSGPRTPDGRGLAGDRVWTFVTRGAQVFLPWVAQSGNAHPLPPTAWPTSPPGPSRTATPTATGPRPTASAPAVTASPSAPTPASPSPTADARATLTALAPSPTATPEPGATATPEPGATATPGAGGVQLDGIFISGPDPTLRRTVFAPGEAITFWLHVTNGRSAPVPADFEFSVIGHGGFGVEALSWSGPLELPPGGTWFRLERTVPSGQPSAPYTFLGSVSAAGEAGTLSSELYLAGSLLRADDFADAGGAWPAGETDQLLWGPLDGEYRVRVKVDDWWARITPGTAGGDIALELDLRLLGGVPGAGGLAFGIDGTGEGFGLFEVLPDGRWAVYRRAGGAWRSLVPPTLAAELRPGEAVNHLALVRRGTDLKLYANGKELGWATDSTADAGRLGIFAAGERAGLDARFDNWRAYALPPGPPAGAAGSPIVAPGGGRVP